MNAKTSAWTAEERAEMAAQRERDNAPGIACRWGIVASFVAGGAPQSTPSFAALQLRAAHRAEAERRALAMREARERAGASCP